jgi:hypothetical protein
MKWVIASAILLLLISVAAWFWYQHNDWDD